MRILNYGSLNLDYVYQVPCFVGPGETLAAINQQIIPGGKGLNQSIALARANASVFHAGLVGQGGEPLRQLLIDNGVDIQYLNNCDALQGNAVIQVTPQGENCILLYGGSNYQLTKQQIEKTLQNFGDEDYLVIQNEVSELETIIRVAHQRKMHIALNPSPFTSQLQKMDYSAIEWLFINEVEGHQMTGEVTATAVLEHLRRDYAHINVVLTLGSKGAWCSTPDVTFFVPAFKVQAVDSTAAGDTFTGYFLASYTQGLPLRACMILATAASAISVSRQGAAISIPYYHEVKNWLVEHPCIG